MKIWLDTTNIKVVQKAVRLGILAGVTTNPSLIAESNKSLEDVLEDLLHHQEGPVTAQVVSDDTLEMVQQGQNLFSFSNRIIVKVPVTEKGLEAIHLLSRQGIPTMGTVVFTPHQALLAALAGADYVAPYLGHMDKAVQDPYTALKSILHIFHNYRLKTKILCASIQNLEQMIKCAELDMHAITLKEGLFNKMIEDHPLTVERVNKFSEDYKLIGASLAAN